jgi:heme/copper-type cytochrome/quinol oxidase subunit 2
MLSLLPIWVYIVFGVGIVVAVVGIILLVVCCRRCRNRQAQEAVDMERAAMLEQVTPRGESVII